MTETESKASAKAAQAEAKAGEKRARQDAAGIPDSRPFIDPATALVPNPMEGYHIDGVLISEMNLPPQVLAALDYHSTDEGIAERNARPMMREASGVEMGADPFAKSLQQRRDQVIDDDMDMYIARDPLKEVADRFTHEGMRPKFLSADSVKQGGGTGDYEVVKYPEGHSQQGDPVMVKGMILGEMPERRAIARNNHYRNRGNMLLKQIGEKHQAEGGLADQ